METREHGEIRIMDESGIQGDMSAGWAPAKKVYNAAFADELNRRFPNFGFADCFDHDIKFGGDLLFDKAHQIRFVFDVNTFGRSEASGGLESSGSSPGNKSLTSELLSYGNKHEADWAGSQDQHILAGTKFAIFNALNDTGQGLNECGVPERSGGRQTQHVFFHNAGGNYNRFSVGSI